MRSFICTVYDRKIKHCTNSKLEYEKSGDRQRFYNFWDILFDFIATVAANSKGDNCTLMLIRIGINLFISRSKGKEWRVWSLIS